MVWYNDYPDWNRRLALVFIALATLYLFGWSFVTNLVTTKVAGVQVSTIAGILGVIVFVFAYKRTLSS